MYICQSVEIFVFSLLIIVACLISSCNYFMHVRDETILIIYACIKVDLEIMIVCDLGQQILTATGK